MLSEQVSDLQQRVSRLEATQSTMIADLGTVSDDVRVIRDTILGARGGLKFLYILIAAAVALGGMIPAWLSWISAKP